MFNERSCVACHSLGGIGGAGPAQNNVDLLTAAPPANPKGMKQLLGRLRVLHPGFAGGTSTVLHLFSTEAKYAEYREQFVGPARKRQAATPVLKVKLAHSDPLLLSQRNTTPLFGAGLIDSINEAAISAVAVEQTAEDRRITGRFLGRFGWRGQVSDLKSFVMGACAMELGLNVPGHPQAPDPLKPHDAPSASALDLTQQQCDDLIEYVASLPAPRRLRPANDQQLELAKSGEMLFGSVGCAVCHRPTLERVKGIYSDLLVHDMGPGLEDPASASTSVAGRYYGGSPDPTSPLAQELRREWKTPPLWGVRDSAPYLHDGRAATIEDAISWHGGEAANSARIFQGLSASDRSNVILFLSTLAAPDRGLLSDYAAGDR
jgi:CxxC motif-containing protein (DUF1111 family)